MPDDLEIRRTSLLAEIAKDSGNYLWRARVNYLMSQLLSAISLLASGAAALFGIVPTNMPKWGVGLLAGLSTALIAASRQLGFQQNANLHYRKTDRLKSLRRRLLYELPVSPTADDIAAISSALSASDFEISKEWEDMSHEPSGKKL